LIPELNTGYIIPIFHEPVFIGYTQKAERKGKSLAALPTRISSMKEYAELFGGVFEPTFTVTKDKAGPCNSITSRIN
jgi:hypothetical protein